MPWNGSGTFTRTNGFNTGPTVWQQDAAADVNIIDTRHDTHDEDLADGIDNCLTKDGENTPTANLPMGGYTHTGVGNATSLTQYAAVNQVQGDAFNYGGTSIGAADAQVIAIAPAPAALAAGMCFTFKAGYTNTGATTLKVNGLTAVAIKKYGLVDLAAADITTGDMVTVEYDGTNFQLVSGVRIDQATIVALGIAKNDLSNVAPSIFPAFRGYIDGCILVNGTDANNDIDIGAGVCRDSTNAVFITVAAITKQLDAAWSAGTNAGGLDTGSKATSTWYHVFAIAKADGTTDALFSTSATSPTMPSGYTYKRRVGSVRTDGSGNILSFRQNGDNIIWTGDSPADLVISSGESSSWASITVSVPPSVTVDYIFDAYATSSSGSGNSYTRQIALARDSGGVPAWKLDLSITAPAGDQARFCGVIPGVSGTICHRLVSGSTNVSNYGIFALGYIDLRGKDA